MLTTTSMDLHAKRYFLTYSQSGNTTKEELLDFLIQRTGVEYYIIGQETHQDGGKHLHAYLEWTRQKRVRSADYFDYGTLHPNIQTVRDAVKCQEYCTKEGDYIKNMEIARGKRTYGEIIKSSTSANEFIASVEDAYPRDLVLNFERIKSYAEHKFCNEHIQYSSEFSTFVIPDELTKWVEDNIQGNGPAGPQSPAYQGN